MGWGGNLDLSGIALQLIHLDLLQVRRMPAKQTETTAKVWVLSLSPTKKNDFRKVGSAVNRHLILDKTMDH